MENRITSVILAVLILFVLAGGTALYADIFNIKLLSDKNPDFTTVQDFADSVTTNWATNDLKARAIAHWLFYYGDQASSPYDWMPLEPTLTFNSLPHPGFCAYWTASFIGIAEGGMGWPGRHYEMSNATPSFPHTVPELEYDGAPHYIDGSSKMYGLDCTGKILGLEEADNVAGTCGIWPAGKYHNLLYHTPMALNRDMDGYTWNGISGEFIDDGSPMRAHLSGSGKSALSRVWIEQPTYDLDQAWVDSAWEQLNTGGFNSVYRYTLNLRDNEHYTRYFRAFDTTSDYVWPGANATDYYWPLQNGGRPDDSSGSGDTNLGNGLWEFTPDLSVDSQFESLTNIERGTPDIHPDAVSTEAIAEFKVKCANLMTGARLEAQLYRKDANDTVIIEVSSNGGKDWVAVWNNVTTGTVNIDQNISDLLKGTWAGDNMKTVLNYYVRVRMTALDAVTDCGLNSIKITTITSLNRQNIPSLKLGENMISFDLEDTMQYETKTLRPLLKGSLYLDDSLSSTNILTQASQTSWSATLREDNSALEANIVYQLDAPRPIFRARMGGDIWVSYWGTLSTNYVKLQYKTYDGTWAAGWTDVAEYNKNTKDNAHNRRHQSHYEEFDIVQPNVTSVQFRFLFRGTDGWSGSSHLRMEVDYPAVDTTFKPVEVTFNWTEYTDPVGNDPDVGGTDHTHTERITSWPHKYYVNCAGDIQPRMNWVRINLEGSSPDAVTLGYVPAGDAGNTDAIPVEQYTWGDKLNIGSTYTANATVVSDGTKTAGDDQELTDGWIRTSQQSSWQPKDLSHFAYSATPLEIVVDLGSTQTVGGVRVDSWYDRSLFMTKLPESISVETSPDNAAWTSQGSDTYLGAKYSNNKWNVDWHQPAQHDSPRNAKGEFPNYGLLGGHTFIPFAAPVAGTRYIKFILTHQTGAGIMLSELNVYDALTATAWSPKLTHEPSLTQPIAIAGASTTFGPAPLTVNFDAGASSDPDGTISSYTWDFGDGVGSGATPSHQYNTPGTYDVTLTIQDNNSNTEIVHTQVTVTTPVVLTGTITSPSADPYCISTGAGTVDFTSSAAGGDGGPYTYEWDYENTGSWTAPAGTGVGNHSYSVGYHTAVVRVTDGIPDTQTDTIALVIADDGGTPTDYSDDSDLDSDGLSDAFEIQYFADLDEITTGDPDGDGVTNLDEQTGGTNPVVYNAAPSEGTKGGCGTGVLPLALLPLILGILVSRKKRS